MSERETAAYLIGKRYDCDECGLEVARRPGDDVVFLSNPPRYMHVCPTGHEVFLPRTYPGWDVLVTGEPVPRKVRKRQPDAPTTHGPEESPDE